MKILFQSLIAMVASSSFVLLFNAMWIDVFLGGIAGGVGWAVYSLTAPYGIITSNLLSALAIGLIGRSFSRIRHIPSQPLITGGIIVLVPGFIGFKAMNAFILGETQHGTTLMLNVLMISASIGIGLIVSVALTSMVFRVFSKKGLLKRGTGK